MTGRPWTRKSSAPLLALLAVGWGGCTCQGPDHGPGPLTRGLLALAREAHGEGLLERDLPAGERTLARLRSLAGEVRAALPRAQHPVGALNRVVFERRGFVREVDDLSLGSVLLPAVLAHRRGSCMGLAALYLALGEQLDLPLAAVLVPGHLFLRYRGAAGARDVELLKRGRSMPREWYRDRYAVPPGNPLYLQRPLTRHETLAVYRYNLANALRERKRLRGALEHYRRVVQILPGFAEAQANLGLTLHRLGQPEQARQAYERARAANPNLPGLADNLKALNRKR